MNAQVRTFAGLDALSAEAADAVATALSAAVAERDRCSLVLSGGSTPGTLYRLLAARWRDRAPWSHVHVFWGDERYVPHADSQSNYRMARDTFLAHVPCPSDHVHPMPTHFAAPDAAARAYEARVREHLGDAARFDVILLGLGEDGHTASLFPGSAALGERSRWVVPVTAPVEPSSRLTLTFPALNRATAVYFLVAGANKADALARALTETTDPNQCPAAGVRPQEGEVIWWIDDDAARQYLQRGGS